MKDNILYSKSINLNSNLICVEILRLAFDQMSMYNGLPGQADTKLVIIHAIGFDHSLRSIPSTEYFHISCMKLSVSSYFMIGLYFAFRLEAFADHDSVAMTQLNFYILRSIPGFKTLKK